MHTSVLCLLLLYAAALSEGWPPLPGRLPSEYDDFEACFNWLVGAALVDDPTDALPAYLSVVVSRSDYINDDDWMNRLLRRLTIPWRIVIDDGNTPLTLPNCGGPSTVESLLVFLDDELPVVSLNRGLRRLSASSAWTKVVVWVVTRLLPASMRHSVLLNALMEEAWRANRWRLVLAVPRAEATADNTTVPRQYAPHRRPLLPSTDTVTGRRPKGRDGLGDQGLVGRLDVYGYEQPLDPACLDSRQVTQPVSLLHSCPRDCDRRANRRERLHFFKDLVALNLDGCPVRITAVHVPPWAMIERTSGPHSRHPLDPALKGLGPCATPPGPPEPGSPPCHVHMGGTLGAFVNVLAQRLNFVPQVHFTSDVPSSKQQTESEHMLGHHVAELVTHQTDLTITSSTLTESRLRVVEGVTFCKLSCFSWTVPSGAGKAISVLMPVVGEFSEEVWLSLLVAVPLVGVLLFAATRVRSRGRGGGPKEARALPDPGQVALGLALLLTQPVAGRWAKTAPVRGVLPILLGTTIVVTAAYQSTLLTTLTLRQPRADIQTPSELFATSLKLRMPQVVLSLLRADPKNVEPRLQVSAMGQNLGRINDVTQFFDGLVTHRDTAVLDTKETVEFYRSVVLRTDRRDLLYQMKGCFVSFVEAPVLFRRGSPLGPALSWTWLVFNQAGLDTRWLHLLLHKPGPVERARRALRLSDMVAAFYLLLIGWLLAASTLALEQSYAKRSSGKGEYLIDSQLV
ncbi:uncharacterized protein LOC113202801 isoform X2 [Frankliniella occidentalis]|uniref:Uncharacterized protein LOC113202801 isoform X2 n=1 Tax=Frankliniella occidentalis TaxID=133901 RepID=A0A9C6U029_FRAOC|nr:uncharacterized protein LOC113202801 isoform X2 [Frankliniella occidentalis]